MSEAGNIQWANVSMPYTGDV